MESNLVTTNKDPKIIIKLKEHHIDMCSFSVTIKMGKGNIEKSNYLCIFSGNEQKMKAASGVDLLVHYCFENNIKNVTYINETHISVLESDENPDY